MLQRKILDEVTKKPLISETELTAFPGISMCTGMWISGSCDSFSSSSPLSLSRFVEKVYSRQRCRDSQNVDPYKKLWTFSKGRLNSGGTARTTEGRISFASEEHVLVLKFNTSEPNSGSNHRSMFCTCWCCPNFMECDVKPASEVSAFLVSLCVHFHCVMVLNALSAGVALSEVEHVVQLGFLVRDHETKDSLKKHSHTYIFLQICLVTKLFSCPWTFWPWKCKKEQERTISKVHMS